MVKLDAQNTVKDGSLPVVCYSHFEVLQMTCMRHTIKQAVGSHHASCATGLFCTPGPINLRSKLVFKLRVKSIRLFVLVVVVVVVLGGGGFLNY